jgi:lipoprotein-anchoring transpeptidase ErfK/SrfK
MKNILTIVLVAIFIIVLLFLGLKQMGRMQKIDNVSELINLAKSFEERGNLKEAKATYQKLVNDASNSSLVSGWEKKIEDLNLKLLFSPVITDKDILYQIQPGDSIAKIAKKFNTTVELILRSNNIKGSKILAGRKIKVHNSPFSMLIDKSQSTLILKSNEELIKTYAVATGINNSTPVGNFKIVNKLVNPTWYKDGTTIPAGSPENILGSRWLGFDLAGYGIHGTNDPASIGKQVTQGCVRMSNQDVEELYTIVPVGTEVSIVD